MIERRRLRNFGRVDRLNPAGRNESIDDGGGRNDAQKYRQHGDAEEEPDPLGTMYVHGYHRARSRKNIANQPMRIRPPSEKTKRSVAGSGSSRVGSMGRA
jgi:hypothetical protein